MIEKKDGLLTAGPKEKTQLLLRSAGHTVYVDGFVGPQTTRAIIEFQRENGLLVTGILDDATTIALNKRGEEFKSVQEKLIKLGFSVGVDGYCGNNTTFALKSFQSTHNLPISGIPDSATVRLICQLVP